MREILLLSTSTLHGSGYLEYCEEEIRTFFVGRETVLFVPYARPGGISHEEYAERTAQRFTEMGLGLRSVHHGADPAREVEAADGIFIGGGNTFVLLRSMIDARMLETIRRRVGEGMPYMGSSAGSNVAGLSIGTTNDMPIVHPPTLEALGLVPFNINPHYLDPEPASTHMGESRETRIREFHRFNEQPVLGLREGALLRVQGVRARLLGGGGGRLFRPDMVAEELAPDADVSFLLEG